MYFSLIQFALLFLILLGHTSPSQAVHTAERSAEDSTITVGESSSQLPEHTPGDRASFSREGTEKEKKELQKARKKLDKKYKKEVQDLQPISKCVPLFGPPHSHYLRNRSPEGITIELENGAIFEIYESDRYLVQNWEKHKILSLVPNHDWFSNYEYRLIYQGRERHSVRAKLTLAPYKTSPTTYRILKIDFETFRVQSNDGSIYQISDSRAEKAQLRKWLEGDYIFFGTNDAWCTWGYDLIIINTSTIAYVTAKYLGHAQTY